MKKIISMVLVATMMFSMTPAGVFPAESASVTKTVSAAQKKQGNAIDTIYFGNAKSEKSHNYSGRCDVKGIDKKASKEKKNAKGMYTGGGIGDGLTYRYMKAPADENAQRSQMQFTLKADPTKQNYLTVRISGSQQGRGCLLLYGPDGDTSVLKAWTGTKYSELDDATYDGAPFEGRYYYSTYMIPQGLVSADGKVTLCIQASGKMDSYGTNVYKPQTQNSKYIYSAAIHTEPYYEPSDNFTGKAPKQKKVTVDSKLSAYEYLSKETNDMMEKLMSWQLYGDEWNEMKNNNNYFLDGAVVTYTPLETLKDFSGTKDEWSRKVTMNAINFQNWEVFGSATIFANAFMNQFSGDYYQNPELLDRIIKFYDFVARSQDAQGGWCYFATGEDKGKWLGANYDGTGERLTGERWPLLALGTDYLTQTFIELDHYIRDGKNKEIKKLYEDYLDEVIDGDLTGKMNKSRREWYMEMFAKIREYLANPTKGDYYNPVTRAGTANQDGGFAFDANEAVRLLEESAADKSKLDGAYRSKPAKKYAQQLLYKFDEMIDGQKWYSYQGLGLEGGASHGGWAGDYGALLLKQINRYAEIGQYASNKSVTKRLNKLAKQAYEAAKYFIYPSVDSNGYPVLLSETYASSRKSGYGQKTFYICGGYSALELGSKGALRIMTRYIEDKQAYNDPLRSDIEGKTPHVYTGILQTQEILKSFKEVQKLAKKEMKPTDYLPLEEEHPDFVWSDRDGQVVVFKDHGKKMNVTFNYRRDDWKYNEYARIHYTEGKKRDTIANVVAINKGGTYEFEDTTVNGETYTHKRFDGFTQAEYDGYVIAMNQSKTDKKHGQVGKSYQVETFGVKKAKDLVTGKVYEGKNGNDISVVAKPGQTLVLKVLKKANTKQVSIKYVNGKNLLGYENVDAVVGKSITVKADKFDGYKLTSKSAKKTIKVSASDKKNVVTFRYAVNEAPAFKNRSGSAALNEWQEIALNGATGKATYDANGELVKIQAKSDSNNTNGSKYFVYQEVTDDFTLSGNLLKFANTKTDKDYFSLIITDNLDIQKGNYVELRHFPNNNNILLVSHSADQGVNVKGYWAGDMNNKAVPIWFTLTRKDGKVSYEYSLDGSKFEKTSKPIIDFVMGDKVYVGAAMTGGNAGGNTAEFKDIAISGGIVEPAIAVGDTKALDFKCVDKDTLKTSVYGYDKVKKASAKMAFTPEKAGSYMFKAQAYDAYHEAPVTKTIQVDVGGKQAKEIAEISNVTVTEGEKVTFKTDAPGAKISVKGYGKASAGTYKKNTYTWNTKNGQDGIYHVLVTYDYEDYCVTRLVKITVEKDTTVIDWITK
ncbi:MAG: hypothetical protein ACI4CT_04420 [Lachnospiraceae bacterium]